MMPAKRPNCHYFLQLPGQRVHWADRQQMASNMLILQTYHFVAFNKMIT